MRVKLPGTSFSGNCKGLKKKKSHQHNAETYPAAVIDLYMHIQNKVIRKCNYSLTFLPHILNKQIAFYLAYKALFSRSSGLAITPLVFLLNFFSWIISLQK